jgi:membrane-associated phospholipid phosphatase
MAALFLIFAAVSTAAHADDSPVGRRAYAQLIEPAAAPVEPPVLPSLRDTAGQAQPHPQPEHTGFQALIRSTASDFKAFPMRKSTWVILGVGGAAAALVHPFDDEIADELPQHDNLKKAFKPGKYLGYTWVQMGGAIGTYVVGRYFYHPDEGRTNKISHLGFDLLRANLLTTALTFGTKYAVRRDRPSGDCCAFPSGHASVTFATASVLERHFGYRSAWPTFVIAGYVAASRLVENQHFASDVLFGAALGMASGWTVVGRHGRDDFALYPVPVRGGAGIVMTWTPGAPVHAAR